MINQVVSFLASTEIAPVPDRIDDGISVLYLFREGSGDRVNDVSGEGLNPINLNIANTVNVAWDAVQGIRTINTGTIFASSFQASKIINAVKASNEITIEAWINVDDPDANGPARIVTISADGGARGATLGQNAFNSPATGTYFITVRCNTSDPSTTPNGNPDFSTDELYAPGQLQHVAYTRNAVGVENIYVNGVNVETGNRPGDFSSWASNYLLALADENVSGERNFFGTYYLAAIYSRALTPTEVEQNFQAGFTNILPKLFPPLLTSLISSTQTSLTIAASFLDQNAETIVFELYSDAALANLVATQTEPPFTNTVFSGLTPDTPYWWRVFATATGYRNSNYTSTQTASTDTANQVPVASNVVLTVSENIVMQDDFTGTVIDTQKWNIVSPNIQISQNGVLTLRDTSGGASSALETNRIESIDTFNGSDYIVAQCNLNILNDVGIDQGFALWIDSNNYIAIINRGDIIGDIYTPAYKKNGVSQNLGNINFSVPNASDLRIRIDLAGVISFEYWDGTAWIKFSDDIDGTNFEILPTDQLRVVFFSESASIAQERSMSVDNVFLTKQPYSTQYPVGGSFILNGTYDYSDADSDPEGASILKLFKDDDGAGTNRVEVTPFPNFPYPVTGADAGKTFYYNVTPVASSGSSPGLAVESAGVQIPGTAFNYGGQSVNWKGANLEHARAQTENLNLGTSNFSIRVWINHQGFSQFLGNGRGLMPILYSNDLSLLFALIGQDGTNTTYTMRADFNIGGNIGNSVSSGVNYAAVGSRQYIGFDKIGNDVTNWKCIQNGNTNSMSVAGGANGLQPTDSFDFADLWFAKHPSANFGHNGLMGYLMIFQSEITASENEFLYNNGNGNDPRDLPSLSSKLVKLWPMSDLFNDGSNDFLSELVEPKNNYAQIINLGSPQFGQL